MYMRDAPRMGKRNIASITARRIRTTRIFALKLIMRFLYSCFRDQMTLEIMSKLRGVIQCLLRK